MQLLAGIHNSERWQQLILQCKLPATPTLPEQPFLSESAAVVMRNNISQTELQSLLTSVSGLHILLCYDAAEYVVAQLLMQGLAIEQAVSEWLEQTTALLLLQQQHRRYLQLAQTDVLLLKPAALPAWLSNHLNPGVVSQHPDSGIYLLLAGQALRQSRRASQLWQRLIACSLPLSENSNVVLDLSALQHQLADNSKLDALQQELKQTSAAYQRAQQAAQTSDKLRIGAEQQQADLTKQLAVANQQQAELDKHLQLSKQQAAASNEERDALLQQLMHVQQELEQLFKKEQTAKQQYSEQEQGYRDELAVLNAQLQTSEQTASKVAQQLQQQLQQLQENIQRLNSDYSQAQQQLNATTEERDVLLQQLMHVQQELEQYFLLNQQMQAEARQNKAEIQQLNDITNSHKQALQVLAEQKTAFESEIVTLNQQQQQNQEVIKQLQRSLLTAENALTQQQSQAVAAAAKYKHCIGELEQRAELMAVEFDKQQLEQTQLKNQKQAEQLAYEQKLLSSKQNQTQTQTKLSALESQYSTEVAQLNNALGKVRKSEQQALQQIKQLNNALSKAVKSEQQALQQVKQLTAEQWREHQAAISSQKKLERELQKQQKLFAVQKSDMNNMRMQLISAEQQLQSITGSRLWRTVAPVRALSSKLHKSASAAKEQLQRDVALVLTSELFDLDWYLKTYQDVAESGINPAEHYLKFGAGEGRYPGPLFDGNWYLQRYPDVAEAGLNPLLHFIKFGQPEGRTASPKLLVDSSTAQVNKPQTKKYASKFRGTKQ